MNHPPPVAILAEILKHRFFTSSQTSAASLRPVLKWYQAGEKSLDNATKPST